MNKKISILTIVILLFLLPFINMAVNSIISINGSITIEEYINVIKDERFMITLTNSIIISLLGSFLTTILTFITAFGVINSGKARIFLLVFISITASISSGIISEFLFYARLGIINSYLVYILPYLISPFYLIVIYTSLVQNDMSRYLIMARIDNANLWLCIKEIIWPMCADILIIVFLFSFFDYWADYEKSLYFVFDDNKKILSEYINILISNANKSQISGTVLSNNYYAFVSAATILYIKPVVFLIVLFRKRIVRFLSSYYNNQKYS